MASVLGLLTSSSTITGIDTVALDSYELRRYFGILPVCSEHTGQWLGFLAVVEVGHLDQDGRALGVGVLGCGFYVTHHVQLE